MANKKNLKIFATLISTLLHSTAFISRLRFAFPAHLTVLVIAAYF